MLAVLTLPCAAQDTSSASNPPVADTETLQQEVLQLKDIVARLQARVDELEQRQQATANPPSPGPSQATGVSTEASVQQPANPPGPPSAQAQPVTTPQAAAPAPTNSPVTAATNAVANALGSGTTLSFYLDTYYEYNFNQPIGRVNLLRAYDILSNAFSINQADAIIENAADPAAGKRWGVRVDLQYGQATQTLQGNPANEPRPEIYRSIFQAYGTYIAPIGKGLTIDIGKFASSLGYEGNYTKDQINYSRSFWFNYLPFYHLGLRANYKFNDKFQVNYWMVNGANQSEPFNGFKDEFIGFIYSPNKNVTWDAQYYLGQEHPDTMYYPNGGAPANAPTLQGTPFEPILNSPTGHLNIIDTWLSWQASPKLLFAVEADDVVSRLYTTSYPQHTDGGAVYLKYQFTPKFYLGTRYEYLSDAGALFSGANQLLQENTITAAYQLRTGFEVLGEWRRDFSNRPYFYTSLLGILRSDQNTAGLGFVWWFGGKQGSW